MLGLVTLRVRTVSAVIAALVLAGCGGGGGNAITIDVQGTDDVSPAGQQFLDSAGAPRPISLLRENGRINLVKRDGGWLACE
jgi:hypothetical protein